MYLTLIHFCFIRITCCIACIHKQCKHLAFLNTNLKNSFDEKVKQCLALDNRDQSTPQGTHQLPSHMQINPFTNVNLYRVTRDFYNQSS